MYGGHAMYGPVPSDLYDDGLHGRFFLCQAACFAAE